MIVTCLSLALFAVQTAGRPAPELLVRTPPGWKFERIDFPLPFAPDLPLRGFEELRFAPGMYDTESDTYFTYVFAMKLEGELNVDAKFLSSLLESYYRGLCLTVAKDRDFKIDGAKIKADVGEDHFEAPRSRHFHAVLESFDPFVTGKPLTLHMEILVVQPTKTDQRIFAAVSPKPIDDPVWKRLRAFKRLFHQAQLQPAP